MDKYLQIIFNFNESFIEQISINIPMFLKHYLVFRFGIIFVLLLVDLLLVGLSDLNFKWYYKVKSKLVKRPSILTRAYRLNQGISKLIIFIRPWYIRYGSRDGKNLSEYIYGDGFITYIKQSIINFFNPKYISNLIAILATIFLYYDIQLNNVIFRHAQMVDIDNLITWLTILPAVIIVLIIIIRRRYTSIKGRHIRGANRLNQKILEETLDIHRRLIKPLLQIIVKGSENIECSLNCKSLLINSRAKKISPHIKCIEDNKVIWDEKHFHTNMYENDDYSPDHIEEIDELVSIIKEAAERHIFDEVFLIRSYNQDMLGVKNFKCESEELEKRLRFYLFTPRTLEKLLKEDKNEIFYKEIQETIPEEDAKECFERQILDDIGDFKERIDHIMIYSIEMLVDLSFYHKSVDRLLHFKSHSFRCAQGTNI